MTRRRLSRSEIALLKHLAHRSPTGIPIVVPRTLQSALVRLWRELLIHVWHRQDPDGRRAQFVSITIDGMRRIEAILSAGQHSRASGFYQGRSTRHDQSSEQKQKQNRKSQARNDAGFREHDGD